LPGIRAKWATPAGDPPPRTHANTLMPSRPTSESSLAPADRARVERQTRVLREIRASLPSETIPYLAHMHLVVEGKPRDLVLAPRAKATPAGSVQIVDWQRSSLAEAFFGCAEGDTCEISTQEGPARALLVERNLVAFQDGELVRIETPQAVLIRTAGRWRPVPREPLTIVPRPKAARARAPSSSM